MPEIKHYVVIKASTKAVYRAITEQEGLAGWWTREVIARPETGYVNEFKFGDRYHNKMIIGKLEEDKFVGWECIHGEKEWIGTHLSFELEEKDGKTSLLFSHKGWRESTLFFASCNFHWGFYMNSLREFCEKGKGTPHQDRS